MYQSLLSQRPGPPHNPGVRDLVQGKREWSRLTPRDARQGFRGWHERGYLPHRDEPGLTQFVTFRLADSFPESLRSEWQHLLQIEDGRQRRLELEAYLDKGRGACHLRLPEVARLVENALLHSHGTRYELRAWVVMPNHVHVCVKVGDMPLARIVESWKKYTAFKANRLLHREGPFWQPDYWDTFIRSSQHEQSIRNYIENNPASAKLVLDPKTWPWSSARFRDEYGVLRL